MPEAVAAAAAAAAEAVSSAVYGALTSAGVSAGAASLASTYAASITAVAVATLAYVGPSILFRPTIPDPEFARSVRKQAIPDRVSGYGRVRVGGAYMLWEAKGDFAYVVLAQVDGLSDGVEALYLNDQVETVGVSGYVQQGTDLRYGKNSDLVQIAYRDGLPTETRYSLLPSDIWPDTARGDGIASLMMIAKASSKEQFLRDYPNGLPVPSTVRRLQICWDPRLGARGVIEDDADKQASATWAWTDNPILQLLDYKTAGSGGPGYPIERFLPRIADWIEAANVCDEAVPLKAGGTEKRYRAGGTYLHSTADADVTATLLATCDGWLAQDIDGNFTVQAGKYYEPTVTITMDHIVGMQVVHGKKDEESVNVMVVSFTDPTFDFTQVETDPRRDQANIDLIGVERSQKLDLPWVQSNSQAQRLAKIGLTKSGQPVRGTIVTTLDGLRAWGERRIRIQADPNESEVMADVVVDILPITLNPDFTVSIPFVLCDVDAYDWNAAVDEGGGAGGDVRPPLEPIATPVIDSITAFADAGTTRLRIYPEDAVDGSTYIMRWRVTGDTAWTQSADQTVTSGYFETSPVTPAALDVQIALTTSSGVQSEWSDTFAANAAGDKLDFNFAASEYRVGGVTQAAPAGLASWSYTRTDTPSGAATKRTAAGLFSSVATDALPVTDRGLVVETASTNLVPQSWNTADASWTVSAATLTPGQADPMGGTGAALITATGGAASHRALLPSVNFVNGTLYAVSAILKAGTTDRVQMTGFGTAFAGAGYANFYLNGAGSVTASGGAITASGITSLGGGEYLCWIAITASATTAASGGIVTHLLTGSEARVPSLTTSGTFYIVGAQVEAAAAPSSSVVSTTTTATRGLPAVTLTVPAGVSTYTATYNGGTTATGSVTPGASFDLVTARPWLGGKIERLQMS